MNLVFKSRSEIDDKKWDACIDQSVNGSLYGKSWYLDIFTQNGWNALILGDYCAVMPVCIKHRLFIPYAIQPFLCQQGGIFCIKGIQIDAEAFYDEVKRRVFLLRILTKSDYLPGHISCTPKQNQVLSLWEKYEVLSSRYNRNTARNINAAVKSGIKVEVERNADDIVQFFAKFDKTKLIQRHFESVKKLIKTSFDKKNGYAIKACLSGEVISMFYYVCDGDKIYSILSVSNPTGKENKAQFLLIDHVIQKYAGQPLVLDFMGSTMSNIARRNAGFGATSETYWQIEWEKLPFFLEKSK
jgi:hypothetical protein